MLVITSSRRKILPDLITPTSLDFQRRIEDILTCHNPRWMTNSRHFQRDPLAFLGGRESKKSFEDIIDGKVGGTAYEHTDRFLVWWVGCELTYDLDQRMCFSCAWLYVNKGDRSRITMERTWRTVDTCDFRRLESESYGGFLALVE